MTLFLWFNGGLFAEPDVIPLTQEGDQHAGRGGTARIGHASSRRSSAHSLNGHWTLRSVHRLALTIPAWVILKRS